MNGGRVPTATYRVQMHKDWGFAAAGAIVPYLRELGISDLYTSPILAARAGSGHGYDVVDPTRISVELGSENMFRALVRELSSNDMGLVLDIVPNHMAIGPENPAWMDVLAHGRASRFADWFDVYWHPKGEDGPAVLVPVLGRPLHEALAESEISFELADGALIVRYFEWVCPLEPGSWAMVLDRAGVLPDCATLAREIPHWRRIDQASRAKRYELSERMRECCRAATQNDERAAQALQDALHSIDPWEILSAQPYMLCHWKDVMRDVAYRRFFDITHLIGVRVEVPDVFRATHQRILELVKDGSVTGLRIDHIDGLADPARYLNELQAFATGSLEERMYILVEKILGGDETLEPAWPVAGTTGYDFMNALNSVFVDLRGLALLASHQNAIAGGEIDLAEVIREQKGLVASGLFAGEVHRLASEVLQLGSELGAKPFSEVEYSAALIAVSACLDVYRTYITRDHVRSRQVPQRDRERIEAAIAEARCNASPHWAAAIDLIERLLLLDLPAECDPDRVERVADFIVKWQQFTGPLAAKGVEDTVLYREARLVSLNEVGADASHIEHPTGIAGFHSHNAYAAAHWPRTMTATSTHDTKRSEDARARIHVLSEIADEWIAAARLWRDFNAPLRMKIGSKDVPDPVTEFFLYQNLLGVWPLDEAEEAVVPDRLAGYVIKAAREAKAHTSWIDPAKEYEEALETFVRAALDPQRSSAFLSAFKDLLRRIAFPGALNALSATLLKIASPGVPDFYQGMELWDFSLVDPDNRRPVDFSLRSRHLDEVLALPAQPPDDALSELLSTWRDGRVKMFIMNRGLALRRAMREVFLDGEYIALDAAGPRSDHLCTFVRRHEDQWAIAIAPVCGAALSAEERPPLGEACWADSDLALPTGAPGRLVDAITGRELSADRGRLRIAEVLHRMPVALLHSPYAG